jgi:signal transduction histidine kinase/ActR/RegA family two-component response regulator
MHPLLRRQLKRNGLSLETLSPEVNALLRDIESAYEQSETDRKLLERSLELSSKELMTQNSEMRAILSSFPDILATSGGSLKDHTFEEIVSKYVQELINSRAELAEAKQVVESALASRGIFLANMSHEIRTPLNGILGMIALLLESHNLSEDHRSNLFLVNQAAQDLLRILNDILDFSKIETGKVELEIRPINLKELFHRINKLLEVKASEKNINCCLEIIGENPNIQICGDDTRVGQVLMNLISNAIKFTSQNGTVSIKYSFTYDDNYCKIITSIRDTGIGIPENKIHDIFDPFSQADQSITRKFGGTGLGLNISRMLARLMNGDIEVESSSSTGTTFIFTAIFSIVDNQSGTIEIPTIKTKSQYIKNALIVEDNPLNQLLARRFLENRGIEVKVAENGLKALDIILQNEELESKFDVILMDCQMPELDGYETTKRIRLWEKEKSISPVYIVALTANAFQEDREKCLNAGMDDFLTKPIVVTELNRVLLLRKS